MKFGTTHAHLVLVNYNDCFGDGVLFKTNLQLKINYVVLLQQLQNLAGRYVRKLENTKLTDDYFRKSINVVLFTFIITSASLAKTYGTLQYNINRSNLFALRCSTNTAIWNKLLLALKCLIRVTKMQMQTQTTPSLFIDHNRN